MQHAFATGLCNIKGEANGRSKLRLSEVRNIKQQLASGRLQKDIAQEFNVKVYTIGIGSVGKALVPHRRRSNGEYIFGYSTVNIDEDLLREIAKTTDGKYYRSTNEESLQRIYDEIDQLEKTKMEISIIKRYSEEYRPFLSLALILLCIDMLLRNSIFRTLP